jgi:amino-acid N-acetyltransferase
MRITDEVALDCAQEAAGQLRYEIEAAFSQGLPNTPMANATVRVVGQLHHRAAGGHRGRGGLSSTAAWCARWTWPASSRTLDMGALVLLSPFGFSPTGEAFNLTMEDVATSVAIALQADKLIFVTESARACREHPTIPTKTTHRHRAAAGRRRALLAQLPAPAAAHRHAFYLQHCVKACKAGVERSTSCPLR